MKILQLLLISKVIKQFRTGIMLSTPFFTHKEILYIHKNSNVEKLAQTHIADETVFEILFKKSNIFSNNLTNLQSTLFQNYVINGKYTSILHHAFDTKPNFSASDFTITQKKVFETTTFVDGNTPIHTTCEYYPNTSLIHLKFFCFSLMKSYETAELEFNALLHSTTVFSILFLAVCIKPIQKKLKTVVQKTHSTKYPLKINENNKIRNVFIFIFALFFTNSFQIFDFNNLTLSIITSSEFEFINNYKNVTKYIFVSEDIYEIPSNLFTDWSSVVYVNFGNSVSNIESYVFMSCFNLETIIFGENVTAIGGGAFSLCSSIKNITIPNSVTSIGNYAFALCSNLTTLTLGYGIREIGGSAFGNCYQLQCIYYYGNLSPEIGLNAFYNVTVKVITYSTYENETFGNLFVAKEYTEGVCKPILTHSFTKSNTFSKSETLTYSHTFHQSETFTKSNKFYQSEILTKSHPNDLTLSFSYTLTITLSITHSFTIYEAQTKSFSLYINNSVFSYIETMFIYYNYTVIVYTTYYNYYSNFFTYINMNENQTNDNNTTTIIIIVICVVVVVIIIITLLIVLLIRVRSKTSEDKENENENVIEKETINTFATGISITNVEEDPFAEDFKEEKFIEQI